MNPPISYRIAHLFCSLVADSGSEVDEKLTVAILGPSRTECIPQKIKLYFRIVAPAIIILAVDDPRFVWMQFEAAFIKTFM